MPSNVSAVTNHFSVASEGFITTLGSSILSGAVTVPLTSVSGLTNGNVFVGIIEPGTVGKEQVFTGVVDTSGSQITGVVWTKNANTSHTAGVTIVDYVTGTGHNMTTKGILVHADQDGTLKAGAVDTAAVLASSVVTNAKILDATIELNAKTAPWDGWTPGGAWVYASSTTMTVPAADAAAMALGTKIKLTQTSLKYFYVTGISGTTVTLNGGATYTLANAAITLPFLSNAATVTGHPIWLAYVGACQANGGTAPTYTLTDVGKFKMDGNTVTVQITKINSAGGTAGSGSVDWRYTFPVTADTTLTAVNTVATGAAVIFHGGGLTEAAITFVGSSTGGGIRRVNTAILQNSDQNNVSRQVYAEWKYQAA